MRARSPLGRLLLAFLVVSRRSSPAPAATTGSCCCGAEGAARATANRRRSPTRSRTTPRALHVRALLADGFGAELLRTYAMARRLAGRGSEPGDRRAGGGGRLRSVPYRERQFDGRWFKRCCRRPRRSLWVDDTDPTPRCRAADDRARRRHRRHRGRRPGRAPEPLRDGYATFLTVVGRRVETPDGRPTSGTACARLPVVRRGPGERAIRRAGWSRALSEVRRRRLVRDPAVVATVLYRMASSELGRRMAPGRPLPSVSGDGAAARRPSGAAARRLSELPGEALCRPGAAPSPRRTRRGPRRPRRRLRRGLPRRARRGDPHPAGHHPRRDGSGDRLDVNTPAAFAAPDRRRAVRDPRIARRARSERSLVGSNQRPQRFARGASC